MAPVFHLKKIELSGPAIIAVLVLLAAIAHPNRVAADEPVYATAEAASADPDFLVQGEYVGEDRAMQVVAVGDGEFRLAIYAGGLPGDGWRGEEIQRVDGDADVVAGLVESMNLRRIDRSSPTLGIDPPPGAIRLFDGSLESVENHWQPGARRSDDGLLMQGATTKQTFRDYVLHLEFRTPFQPTAEGQGRGNSGVYHQGRYENQILDSFGLEGTKNETGSIYDIRRPDINVCFPPLSWQTYDIAFTAARFDDSGMKTANAKMTVRLNGIIVQNEMEAPRSTRAAPLGESPQPGPLYLQDHGNPVRFRNIWILPRDASREALRPRVPAFERFYGSATGAAAVPDGHVGAQFGGQLLASNLGCGNCHAGLGNVWKPASGPILTDVASRLRPDHLFAWIAAPHQIKPGTTMPDMLAGMTQAEKQRAAKAITSYLLTVSDGSGFIDRGGDATAVQRGEQLYHSVGCLACHAPQDGRTAPDATSVPLGDLNAKYTLISLAKFLLDPHAVRPAGRMPKIAADATEARDLATYLLRDTVVVPGGQQFIRTLYRGSWDALPDFSTLTPAEPPSTVVGLTFSGIDNLDNFGATYEAYLPIAQSGKYRFRLGSDDGSRLLIDGREVVRVDGVHPFQQNSAEIALDSGVHRLRIEFFESGGGEELALEVEGGDMGRADITSLVTLDPQGDVAQELVPVTFNVDADLVQEGAKLFQSVGCVNCHLLEHDGNRVPVTMSAMALSQLRDKDPATLTAGCLAESVPPAAANYDLNAAQRSALVASILDASAPLSPEANIHLTMAAANCYACHLRDGIGGPETARETFFQTTTPEMGNEGRVPPPLDGVGDKLQDDYVARVLEQGANERPYMMTRMPAFGYEDLRPTHQQINRLDRITAAQIPAGFEPTERSKADGRTLVGNDGLACIKCHTFGDVGTSGIQAIDMLKMTDRLRSDWFHRYLRDPQRYRPGTRMPQSFPDDKSVLVSMADGDPAYQIEAMWHYLRDGDQAKIPTGLRPGAIELIPTTRPIIYRNFLTDMTPRGIAVGYPEGIHLAWDANRMALRRIWQNQFLDASLHWQGRGPGQLGPLGDLVVDVEPAAPLARLDSLASPWPETTDDQTGYRFLGYNLDSAGRPTFLYRLGDVQVNERYVPAAETDGQQRVLRREFSFDQPPASLVFRAAAGNIQPVEDGWYRIDDQYDVKIEGVSLQTVTVHGGMELRGTLDNRSGDTVTQFFRW
jgi:cytochrome c2